MILYPKIYLNNIKEITTTLLEENNIKGLILDVDNTLIDSNKNVIEGIDEWTERIKKQNIKLCILSNSNNKNKVKNIANKLDIPYIFLAMKPLKRGFKKAKKILNLEYEKIGVVGDQIFTDVLGANRCKMKSILVKPLTEKDIFFVTNLVRKLEKKILKKSNIETNNFKNL